MSVPSFDRKIGLETYVTKSQGIDGLIKKEIEDFVVEEILADGSRAQVSGTLPQRVLGSTHQRQRFLLCVLIKRGWDTFIAVKNVAKQLGIDQGMIQVGGIKDARALTAQHITIDGGKVEDVSRIQIKDISLHPVGYVREALSAYYLQGNHFTIRIRGLLRSKSIAEEYAAQTMQELESAGGVPNFYGHQRFGTIRPITHLVGKEIIQGNFEGAAMLFLAQPSPEEHPHGRQARQQLQETRDFKQALDAFPKQLRFERIMLLHLNKNPTDFLGAFQRLPMKLQELFVQAHQSFLFNRFLSGRLAHGYALNRAIEGDFVVGVERSGLPMTRSARTVSSQSLAAVNEQVKGGKIRVALPIVGLRPKLSFGAMGDIEREILDWEGIPQSGLRVNPLSFVGGKGGLRAAVSPISDFKFNVVPSADAGYEADLSFMLQRGCYATAFLREIMKPENPLEAGF